MRGPAEPAESFGLGKKVEKAVEAEPEWKAVKGKQHHYVNAQGKKSYAPPVPDVPQHINPWDMWADYMRRAAEAAERSSS